MAEVEIIKPIIDINYSNVNKNRNSKKRVCAYCRVSTDNEEQLTSYNSQITHYTDYIKKNPDWEFAGIYADEGITGTQIKNRDEFIRMIDDCKLGKIDIIIAKSISRFARNTVDTLNTVRLLRELNIDVYFEKENIHTSKMESEMFLTLYSAFAQAESESTSLNVRMGLKAKMKRGEAVGQPYCYGYSYDKSTKEIHINESEAYVVRKIFKYYLDGYGSTRIAQKLMEEGIPAPYGGCEWHPSPIKDMLRNVKYVGDLCSQKWYIENPMTHKERRNRGEKQMYYVKNHHEAIISREVFNKVQEIYKKRSMIVKEGKVYCEKFSMRYIFSSIITCEECGRTFVRRVSNFKNKDGIVHPHIYWTCSSKTQKNIDNCNAVTIRDEELKSLFVSLYNKFIIANQESDLFKIIKNVISNENNDKKLQTLNKRKKVIMEKISKLIDLNINQDIDKETFLIKNEELNNELLQIKKEINNILDNKNKKTKEENKLKQIKNEVNGTTRMYKFNEEIFKMFIKRIIIGNYDEKDNYNPNVVKFVLNIDKSASTNEYKLLSLGIDERYSKP